MASSSVSRRPSCPSKAFNLQSRGASLDTTAAGSVQWSSYSSSSASCAGHASPVLDTSSTLIYLDWDDTLFPSTEIFDRWGLPHQWDSEGLTAKQEQLLHAWGESLQRFLKACMEYSGSCVIVTNAQSRWVENCLRRFAPELVSLFQSPGGPTVLYAKEVLRALRLRKKVRHQDDSVIPAKHLDAYWDEEDTQRFKFVEMSAAKFHAMKQEFLDFFSGREGHSRRNIINFGDMEYEHEAVKELGCACPNFVRNQPSSHCFCQKSRPETRVLRRCEDFSELSSGAEDQRVDRSAGIAPLTSVQPLRMPAVQAPSIFDTEARHRQSQQRHRSRLEGRLPVAVQALDAGSFSCRIRMFP